MGYSLTHALNSRLPANSSLQRVAGNCRQKPTMALMADLGSALSRAMCISKGIVGAYRVYVKLENDMDIHLQAYTKMFGSTCHTHAFHACICIYMHVHVYSLYVYLTVEKNTYIDKSDDYTCTKIDDTYANKPTYMQINHSYTHLDIETYIYIYSCKGAPS